MSAPSPMMPHEDLKHFEHEQARMSSLLIGTVTMLCKSGLTYRHNLKVQGVLGITVDDKNVFVVHIDEKYENEVQMQLPHSMAQEQQQPQQQPQQPQQQHEVRESDRAMHCGIPQQIHRERSRSRLGRPSPYPHHKMDRYSDVDSSDMEVVMANEPHHPPPPVETFQKSISYAVSPEALVRPTASHGHLNSKRQMLGFRGTPTPSPTSELNAGGMRVKGENGEQILIVDYQPLQSLPQPPQVTAAPAFLTKGAQKFINSAIMADQFQQQQQPGSPLSAVNIRVHKDSPHPPHSSAWTPIAASNANLKLALASQSSSPASSGGTAPDLCDAEMRREYGHATSTVGKSRETSPQLNTPHPELSSSRNASPAPNIKHQSRSTSIEEPSSPSTQGASPNVYFSNSAPKSPAGGAVGGGEHAWFKRQRQPTMYSKQDKTVVSKDVVCLPHQYLRDQEEKGLMVLPRRDVRAALADHGLTAIIQLTANSTPAEIQTKLSNAFGSVFQLDDGEPLDFRYLSCVPGTRKLQRVNPAEQDSNTKWFGARVMQMAGQGILYIVSAEKYTDRLQILPYLFKLAT
ncbi:hypothetical protein CAPTEDRAFT_205922 [Capitella teleta]|uniref:Uncharacterized protein n=1 Tax=Capitella teleta TaxID=283909 RepID=R7UGG8_CAPTE|nr:hypothetical protein CAPTEDRAFT_205922 [Capitella teleta]|eukprot:ELU02372.1 hypothetical protein CAPTEDRAFT_205922 [Capitella teleta]